MWMHIVLNLNILSTLFVGASLINSLCSFVSDLFKSFLFLFLLRDDEWVAMNVTEGHRLSYLRFLELGEPLKLFTMGKQSWYRYLFKLIPDCAAILEERLVRVLVDDRVVHLVGFQRLLLGLSLVIAQIVGGHLPLIDSPVLVCLLGIGKKIIKLSLRELPRQILPTRTVDQIATIGSRRLYAS